MLNLVIKKQRSFRRKTKTAKDLKGKDNYWLKCIDTQINKSTNQNLVKVPKVIKPTNQKILFKNFGDWGNKQPNVPALPIIFQYSFPHPNF